MARQILAALARHLTPKVETAITGIRTEPAMKKERRWMKSIVAASTEAQAPLPWARGTRRRPEAMKTATAKPRAIAAR